MVKIDFLENRQFLPPYISWKLLKKPDRFAYTFLDRRFLERIPYCIADVLFLQSFTSSVVFVHGSEGIDTQ
jgi:hypothetical protein